LVPDENDDFSYRQLLMKLTEMKDQVETEDVVNLLTKVVDVQLSETVRSTPMSLLTDSRILSEPGSLVKFLPSVLTL
jgi:hypothetical protein